MRADPQGDALVTCAERHDFRGVHPGDVQNSPGNDVEEEEAEGDKNPLRLLGAEVRMIGMLGQGRGGLRLWC